MTTTEPTVTVTGLRSGQTYSVPAGVAIKADNSEYGFTVLEDSEGRIRSERNGERYSTLAVSAAESPVECRRKGYKALGYVILHADTPGDEVAVPLDVARNYSGENRLYTGNPIFRLKDNQPVYSIAIRETPAEIEALLPKPEPSPTTSTDFFATCMEIANAFKECAEAGQHYLEAQQNITRLMSELQELNP